MKCSILGHGGEIAEKKAPILLQFYRTLFGVGLQVEHCRIVGIEHIFAEAIGGTL